LIIIKKKKIESKLTEEFDVKK